MRPRLWFGNPKLSSAETDDTVTTDYDATAWLLHSSMAEFLLLHTIYIKYMVMFGYTYFNGTMDVVACCMFVCCMLHICSFLTALDSLSHCMHTLFVSLSLSSNSNQNQGCKLFSTLPPHSSFLYKYVSMILQCTGGGIIVPILINYIPVPIGQDSYPIIITCSFVLHYYFPFLRDVTRQSPILQGTFIVLYETMRAAVVVKFIQLAHRHIPPSEFSIPVFGPIICGTIAGCGSYFIPFHKGLDAIKDGIPSAMISAFIAAVAYHCLVHTTALSQYVHTAPAQKGQVLVAIFFIAYHFTNDFHPLKLPPPPTTTVVVVPVEHKKHQ
jgi:hypothetical protein